MSAPPPSDLEEPLLPPGGEPDGPSFEPRPLDDSASYGNDGEESEDRQEEEEEEQQQQQQQRADEDPWRNHNVRLSAVLCALSGVADSVWGAVVLSGFLYALGRAMGKEHTENTLVGAAEAAQGTAQLVFALPVGVLADRWGKARVVRWGAALMLVTVGVTLRALRVADVRAEDSADDARSSYVLMVVALALWGVLGGIANGPSQALFADSVPKGRRSEMYTWLTSTYLLASVAGPAVSIALFLTVSGDAEDWSLHEIYPVFVAGIVLEIPVAVCMFFFSDAHAVKEEEGGENGGNEGSGALRPQGECNETEVSGDQGTSGVGDSEDERPGFIPFKACSKGWGKESIPYILFVSSLVVSLGSGASVKYFPLFFKELGLTSAEVQGIFLAVPVFIAAFSFVTQWVSRTLGRIETVVLFDIVGVSLLFLMTYLSRDEDCLDSANKVLIIGVYLLRTGIMNGSYPILESVLMDNVPSNRRARWKGLESIASFGWTGSALAGGLLSDRHSYRFTFSITTSMQLIGALLLIPIQPFVECEVVSEEGNRSPQEGNEGEDNQTESLL